MKNKIVLIALAIVILVGGFFIGKQMNGGSAKGGTTNLDTLTLSEGLNVTGATVISTSATIGSSGTSVSQLNYGSCNLLPNATTIAASSTARVTCQGGTATTGQTALTGITMSSKIIGTLSTTTAAAGIAIGANAFGGLGLLGATASTTSGFIETLIINNTGGTYTWPTSGSASGTMQYIGIK